jgi:hypothetical protein
LLDVGWRHVHGSVVRARRQSTSDSLRPALCAGWSLSVVPRGGGPGQVDQNTAHSAADCFAADRFAKTRLPFIPFA